jgi:hypothetical protein
MRRSADKLLKDILLAADVAEEIVARGRDEFDQDLVVQFGAEAVPSRAVAEERCRGESRACGGTGPRPSGRGA